MMKLFHTLKDFQTIFPEWTFIDSTNIDSSKRFDEIYDTYSKNDKTTQIIFCNDTNEELVLDIVKKQNPNAQVPWGWIILLNDGGFHVMPYDRSTSYLTTHFKLIFNNSTIELHTCGTCKKESASTLHFCKHCGYRTCISCFIDKLKIVRHIRCFKCDKDASYEIPKSVWIDSLQSSNSSFWLHMIMGIDGEESSDEDDLDESYNIPLKSRKRRSV